MSDVLHISAADLGSNTIKILHAQRHPDGRIDQLQHVTNTIRLGTGIETTGSIEPQRIDACIEFLREQEAAGRELGSTIFIGVATETLRIASNGRDLLDRIARETAWQVNVISGQDEADLTFAGLRPMVPTGAPSAIADIGGGSTEFIAIDHDEVVWQQSLPLGSGRLADRFFEADPPGMEATTQAFAYALDGFEALEALPVRPETILFSGGNGVFLADLGRQLYPDEHLTLHTIERVLQHLSVTPASDTVDRLGIALARARVFPAGVAIALAAMTRTRAPSAAGVPSGIHLGLISRYTG